MYSKPDPRNPSYLIGKGIGELPFDPDDIRAAFGCQGIRKKWDNAYDSARVVERIDTNSSIAWALFKVGLFISPRDFVTICRATVLDDGSTFSYFGNFPDHPDCPQTAKVVRGQLAIQALYITPLAPGRSRIIYCVSSNPMGNFGPGTINVINVESPYCIRSIGDLMKDPANMALIRQEESDNWATSLQWEKDQAAEGQGDDDDSDNETTGEQGAEGSARDLDQANYAISLRQTFEPTPYDEKIEKIMATAIQAVERNEDDGWTFHSESNGIKVYMKKAPDGQKLNYSKGIGTIQASAETIRCVFATGATRPKWDSMYNSGDLVERIDTNTTISYAAFNGVSFVSGRDFCTIGRSVVRPDGSILVAFGNHETPKCPPVSKLVRGKLIFSAMLITPSRDNPNSCQVVYALGNDPCGSIPSSLVNAAAVAQPACIANVNKFIQSDPAAAAQAVALQQQAYREFVAKSSQISGGEGDAASKEVGPSSINEPIDTSSLDQANYCVSLAPKGDYGEWNDVLSKTKLLAWEAVTEDQGWDFHSEQQGVKIWLKPSDTGILLSKGKGSVHCAPETVRCILQAGQTRQRWDSMYDHGRVVERLDENTQIGWACFKAPFPVSSRDFCSLERTLVLADGSIFIYQCNAKHPGAPETSKYVRGTLQFGAWLLRPVNGGLETDITYALGTDPGGSISKGLANAAAVGQPLAIAQIGEVVKSMPDVVTESQRIERVKWDKLQGLEENEAIPGVYHVEWPSTDQLVKDENSWLQPLHDFASMSTFDVIKRTDHGALLSPLSAALRESTPENNRSPTIGVLGLNIVQLRGKYLSVTADMHLTCVVTVGETIYTTSEGPKFTNDKLTVAITRPDTVVSVQLWALQKQQRTKTCLGSIHLTLGELFEGDGESASHGPKVSGTGKPTAARRIWFAFSNVPVELDRSSTHAELIAIKTKSGKEGANISPFLSDPPGIFICLESCYIISRFRYYISEISATVNNYATPAASQSAMTLALPLDLAQPAQRLLPLAPVPKDPALCRRVGEYAMLMTTGSTQDLSYEADDLGLYSPTGTHARRLAQQRQFVPSPTNTLSPELLLRNFVRLFFAFSPFLSMFNLLIDLVQLRNLTASSIALFAFVYLCLYPSLLVPVASLFVLYTALVSAAEDHFIRASTRYNTSYARLLRQKYSLTTKYLEKLRILIPKLTPKAQACGLLLQVVAGNLASFFERILSWFHWHRGDQNTAALVLISVLLLARSAFAFAGGPALSASLVFGRFGSFDGLSTPIPGSPLALASTIGSDLFVTVALIALTWNLSFAVRLRIHLAAFLRTVLRLSHLRRESRMALFLMPTNTDTPA